MKYVPVCKIVEIMEIFEIDMVGMSAVDVWSISSVIF